LTHMEPGKWKAKPVKPIGASNIKFETIYIDEHYRLDVVNPAITLENGQLEIFHVLSQDTVFPNFRGRWDQNQNTVDVEMADSNGKWKKEGFEGHHTQPFTKDPRIQKVDIRLGQLKIFDGLLTLTLGHGVSVAASMKMFDASLQAIKNPSAEAK